MQGSTGVVQRQSENIGLISHFWRWHVSVPVMACFYSRPISAIAAILSLTLVACTLPFQEREGAAAGGDALRELALARQDIEVAFAGFDPATTDTELARGAVRLRAPQLPVTYTGKYAMTPGRVLHPSLLGPDSLLAREERSQKLEAAFDVPASGQSLGASYETQTLIESTSRHRFSARSGQGQVWFAQDAKRLSMHWNQLSAQIDPAACSFASALTLPLQGGRRHAESSGLELSQQRCYNPPSPLFGDASTEDRWRAAWWRGEADERMTLSMGRFHAGSSETKEVVRGYALGLDRNAHVGPLDARWMLGLRQVQAPRTPLDGQHWSAQLNLSGQYQRLDLNVHLVHAGGAAISPLHPAASSQNLYEVLVGTNRLLGGGVSHPNLYSGFRMVWWDPVGHAPADGALHWDFALHW